MLLLKLTRNQNVDHMFNMFIIILKCYETPGRESVSLSGRDAVFMEKSSSTHEVS